MKYVHFIKGNMYIGFCELFILCLFYNWLALSPSSLHLSPLSGTHVTNELNFRTT
jgi:hypothetical protein